MEMCAQESLRTEGVRGRLRFHRLPGNVGTLTGKPLKIVRESQGLDFLESCTELTQNVPKFAPISFGVGGSQREARARCGYGLSVYTGLMKSTFNIGLQ